MVEKSKASNPNSFQILSFAHLIEITPGIVGAAKPLHSPASGRAKDQQPHACRHAWSFLTPWEVKAPQDVMEGDPGEEAELQGPSAQRPLLFLVTQSLMLETPLRSRSSDPQL